MHDLHKDFHTVTHRKEVRTLCTLEPDPTKKKSPFSLSWCLWDLHKNWMPAVSGLTKQTHLLQKK